MRLTIQLKLLPTPSQADALTRTLTTANAACDAISHAAWEAKTFRQFPIHRLTYAAVRATFGLTAQLAVRCIAKVADAYKVDRKGQRTFQPFGAVAFDDRILAYTSTAVSIWTMDGRQTIPFVCGARQRQLLASRRGETDLACVRGTWYLFASCDVETPDPIDSEGVLGVDLGIVNLAADSDGTTYSGAAVQRVREQRFAHRDRLQRANTRRARWRLRQIAKREHRFQKDVNHCISKALVQTARTTRKTLALEDLTHIRARASVRRTQRRARHAWAFRQLRAFISYKAAQAGVRVVLVDPRNTSRTCAVCGCCDPRNRRRQAWFSCIQCGHTVPADTNAAVNISRVGVVNHPIVDDLRVETQAQVL